MNRIIIDNKDAVLNNNFSTELSFENTYFTKTSSYSLDIELPMPANSHIYGSLERRDVTKTKDIKPAKLYVNNRLVINGSAVVLSVDDEIIKIQLISGNAEFNFLTNDDIYIDELELGTITNKNMGMNISETDKRIIFDPDNDYVYTRVKVGEAIFNDFYFLSSGMVKQANQTMFMFPQIKLTAAIRKIVEYFGYSMGQSYIQNSWMKYLYIVAWGWGSENNVRKSLPHWTVSEFFDNIEKFAGVITVIDENDKTLSLIDINNYFDSSTYVIDKVFEEYETKINDKTIKEDITKGNTEYKLPSSTDNGYNRFNGNIEAIARVYEGADYDSVYSKWQGDTDDQKKQTVYKENDRKYINYIEDDKNTFKEVDQYGNLVRDTLTDEVKNSLAIVPAAISKEDIGLWESDGRTRYEKIENLYVNIPITSYNPGWGRSTVKSIQDYLNGDEKSKINSEKKETLEVAIYTGIKGVKCGNQGTIYVPIPFMDYQNRVDNQVGGLDNYSLSLKLKGENTMGGRQRSLVKINSDVEYKFQFISDIIPPVNKTFIINNQRYLVKKFEVTLEKEGMSKIIEGTFYKIS